MFSRQGGHSTIKGFKSSLPFSKPKFHLQYFLPSQSGHRKGGPLVDKELLGWGEPGKLGEQGGNCARVQCTRHGEWAKY